MPSSRESLAIVCVWVVVRTGGATDNREDLGPRSESALSAGLGAWRRSLCCSEDTMTRKLFFALTLTLVLAFTAVPAKAQGPLDGKIVALDPGHSEPTRSGIC